MDSIDRQAAIETVHEAIYEFFDLVDDDAESPMTYLDKKLLEVNKAITNRLNNLPAAQERKKGKWIKVGDRAFRCSVCNEVSCCMGDYCPDCGAEMRKETEDEKSS